MPEHQGEASKNDESTVEGPSRSHEENAASGRRQKKARRAKYTSFVEAIKDWLRICDEEHTCVQSLDGNTRDTLKEQSPSWLIDVEDRCIVRGDAQPYIALSYTWADATELSGAETETHKPLQLDHDTHSMLETRGSLSNSDVASMLPKVIRDAIELTPMIGQKYLWVDRLCIAQDEPSTLSEVMRMDHIYSGARLTLVAAAEHGLYDTSTLGESHANFNRPNFRQVGRFPPRLLRPKNRDHSLKMHYEAIANSRWARRAWTYQEHILSKRVVFFLGDRVFWECGGSVWDMHGLAPHEHDSAAGPFMRRSNTGTALDLGLRIQSTVRPDFGLYADLICPYNGRQLTYHGDGISACSGLLNRLTVTFSDGFLYGLPRNSRFLDCALLWQPLRRPCYRRESLATGTQNHLPSWSWCGWECYVDPRSLLPGTSLDDNPHQTVTSSWKVQSVATWDVMGHDGIKFPISGPNKRDEMLPYLVSKVEQAFFYTAVTLQVSAIRICNHTTEHRKTIGHPFLTDIFLAETPLIAVLTNEKGKLSGLLRITGNTECLRGDILELVAISKGSASRSELEKSLEEMIFRNSQYNDARDTSLEKTEDSSSDNFPERSSHIFTPSFNSNGLWVGELDAPRCCGRSYQVETKGDYSPDIKLSGNIWGDGEICEFYNVLWVKRKDGVAYRMGCGRIAVNTWVANKSNAIEITLG